MISTTTTTIGIDAKWYFNGNPSGKVVVQNIVDEILNNSKYNFQYVLFLQKRDKIHANELENRCKNNGNVKVVYCISTVNFISNIFILPFYAVKHGVDVCLLQNFTPFLFSKRINYVAYIHDFLFFDYPKYYTRIERIVFKLMKITSKYAKKLITISKSEQQRIAKYTKRPIESINVVYHGVSDDFKQSTDQDNQLLEKYNLPEKYILFLGRINARKNIEILLNSISEIDPLFKIVIVGKKDHKTFNIEKYIEDLNISNRVILLGHVEFQDLTRVVSNAHLFVFPSFAEGFGLPPLEAMKSGVPVVVSNATCLPEVCGSAALYFTPNNKMELINQINRLINDNDLYEEMKVKGLEYSSQFTWKKSADNIIQIISEIK